MNATSGAERRTTGGDGSADVFSSSLGRPRGDNPVTGFATPRALNFGGGGGDFVSFPFYGPWGGWYPWYGAGFGWGVNFYGYNPWYYGATCWGWGRWGAWYDPFGYCWGSYYWTSPPYVEVYGGGNHKENLAPRTGNLRIVASPKTAKVYVDDALVGTVDEFDGLGGRLEIDTGRRVITLKAEGYETATQEVKVEGGRTQTVRFSLKKAK